MNSQALGLTLSLIVVIAVVALLIVRSPGRKNFASKASASTRTTSQEITVEPAQSGSESIVNTRGLSKSQSLIGTALSKVFTSASESTWQELEDSLIMADTGADVAHDLVRRIRTQQGKSSGDIKSVATEVLTDYIARDFVREIDVESRDDKPAVILVVGVNGAGKTTTVGKLAHWLATRDRDVVLGAADTFRAAAADQLETWGDRNGVPVVRGAQGADPASVAFDTVTVGIEQEVDVVLIDTAGRLHTKQGLMDELGKVHRVVSKAATVTEVLLVIDATTGQDGLAQAKVFAEVVPLTGVILTKLDGTAKGGIVIAVQHELNIPVKFVGLGEGISDLVPFSPSTFVSGLINS